MTGVIEVALVAAPIWAWKRSKDQEREEEEREAQELFRRFFPEEAWEALSDTRTAYGKDIPAGVDNHAVQCIRIIERYEQDGTKPMWTSKATKVRVLEELKRWFLTVNEGCKNVRDIARRLDYCQQYLLRPDIFGSSSKLSFLQTLAETAKHLDDMYKEAAFTEKNGASKLLTIVRLGHELVELLLPVLILTLVGEAGGSKAKSNTKPPGIASVATLRDELFSASQSGVPTVLDVRRTTVGRLMLALFSTSHAADLCATDDEALLRPGFVGNGAATSSGADGVSSGDCALAPATNLEQFAEMFRHTEEEWAREAIPEGSGLLEMFCTPKQKLARLSFLQVCWHLDRVLYFLCTLRPYQRLANGAGDIALCQLHACLGHALHELEASLVELRQARLEIMGCVKRQLQELGRKFTKVTEGEKRWMQRLRHVDERGLDSIHKGIVAECTGMRASFSLSRAVELEASARRGVEQIAQVFFSADYLARSAIKPPMDSRALAITGDAYAAPPRALTAAG